MGMNGIVESVRLAIIKTFEQVIVKFENRSGDIIDGKYFQSSGEDSPPLPGDTVVHVSAQRQGGRDVAGVMDTKPGNHVAVGGEVRRYARDSAGDIVGTFHLKKDGTITFFNTIGAGTIAPDGTVTFSNSNGTVTIAPDGVITNTNPGGSTVLDASGTFTVNANLVVNGNTTTNGDTVTTGFTQSASYAGTGGGDVSMTSDINMNNNDIIAANEVVINGVNESTHVHAQGPDSDGDTQVNTGGPQ